MLGHFIRSLRISTSVSKRVIFETKIFQSCFSSIFDTKALNILHSNIIFRVLDTLTGN